MDIPRTLRPDHRRPRPEINARDEGARKIRAVGFDFDHTLGLDNKLERVAFLQLLELACEAGASRIGTLHEESQRIDALLVEQRSGAFGIDEAVCRFLRERGVTEPDRYVASYKRIALASVDRFVVPQPGVRSMLEALARRGIRAGMLTNGWAPLQQAKARRVGFHGPILVSGEIGVQKPAYEAFAALAQALDVRLEALAYVGDTPESDIAGALGAGAYAVWLDAEERPYPADLPPPSAVIHDLTELPALV